MPNRGSGRVLFPTNAATTVVGTVTSCHPLGENCGVQMTSPLASTLAEVCRDQPSRNAIFVSEACVWLVFWARSSVTRRNWAERKSMTARRWLKFMVLLSIAVRAHRISLGHLAEMSPEWITLLLIRFN